MEGLGHPNWTVLFNDPRSGKLVPPNEGGRCRSFFYNESFADELYAHCSEQGLVPTKRPWHESDREFME